MLKACHVMTKEPVTLGERASLDDARRVLSLRRIRHLPIVRRGKVVGVLSERDLLRAWPHHGERAPERISVREVMTKDVFTVLLETPLQDVIHRVLEHKVGCVPVTDDGGRLIGIITSSDLLRMAKQHADEQDLRELASEFEP